GTRRARRDGQRRRAGDDPDADEPPRPGRPRAPGLGRGPNPHPPRRPPGRHRRHGRLPLLRGGELLHRQHLLRRRRLDAQLAASV
ncbi:MAG: 3-oxoacyl-[acyl-carrier protein] reductase, partial [uncultured Thermomicrobiales bacterium]